MTEATVVIIDYGVGNLHSLARAFTAVGATPCITEDPEIIMNAPRLVLPGVGAFAAGMHGLERRGLVTAVTQAAARQVPILGICLGAQLLLTEGHEFGTFKGLNLIPGTVERFPTLPENEKIPHIGWNAIIQPESQKWENSILNEQQNKEVYFVHSYILKPQDPAHFLATTKYGGYEFCSVVKKDKITGCQFHPEKSGEVGLRIIKNFSESV